MIGKGLRLWSKKLYRKNYTAGNCSKCL